MGQGDGSGEVEGKDQGQAAEGDGKVIFVCFCCVFIVVIVLVLALTGLEIAKIVMGAEHIDDCPIEDLVPVYLIVSGCAPFLMASLTNLRQKNEDETGETNLKDHINIYTVLNFIGFLFTFAWLICGSVWVFGNYSDVMDGCGGSNDCCDESLMKFALAVVIIDWIFLGLLIIVICLLSWAVCSGILPRKGKVGT